MKKRLGSILLALAIALSLVPAFAPEARAGTETPGGEFGEGLRWEISNGTLGVYGDGEIPNYTKAEDQPWYAYRTSITSLIVGNGVTRVGTTAFYGLSELESVTFYDSLKEIGQFAFGSCYKLKDVMLPNSLQIIEYMAFSVCNALGEITIPGGVTTIGNYAFAGCTSLVGATLQKGVSIVGNHAFTGCSALAHVRIPISVTVIQGDAFASCPALKDVCYAGTKNDWTNVTVNGGNDSLTDALRCTWSGTCGRDLTWTFCNGTLTISGKGAMPDYDEHRAPWHDYINGWLDIKDVIVEEGVTYIGAKAFYGYGIDTLDLPVSVASIGKKVLYTPWIDVYYHGSEEQRKSIDGVNMIDNDYLWQSSWHDGCGRGTCGEALEWTFRDGMLAISGWGKMDDYGSSSLTPWAAHRDVMTKLVVGEGLRSIGNSAFGGTSSLAFVTLPASLKTVGADAFGRGGDTFKAVYYGGSAEDREAIEYLRENQRLTNSPWLYYCDGPVTVSGKKADDAGTKLAWSVRNAQSGSLLIIARYDPAGKMENVELVAIERSEDGLIDLSSFEADSVFRFMLVDSKTFAPLCEVCSYTVNFEYEL